VLFVCTANICRSPYMQLMADRLADGVLDVSSAGTHGYDDHDVDVEMRTLLTAREVSSDSFRSRRLTAELVDEADLVLTAEVTHRRFILDEQPGAFRKVFTLGQFAAAVRNADGLIGQDLLAEIATRRPHADPSLDVADPYRQGPDAAARAAEQIESLLQVVVPALAAVEPTP
jgi:sulfate adenylyltransferase